ncbi:MAG: hypothetical protein AAF657_21325 [Acidobacteriota bacterium]
MNRKAFLCLLTFNLFPTLLIVPQATADVDGSWLLGTGGSVSTNSFICGNSRKNLSIYVYRGLLPEAKIVGRMIAPGGSPGPGCVYVKEGQIYIENSEYRLLQEHSGYS